MTDIFDAVEKNDLNSIRILIARGLDLEEFNEEGLLPIHLAAINNNFEVVKLLIESGANINALSLGGIGLVHIAASKFNLNMLNWLYSKGMDIKPKCFEFIPVYIAANAGKLENIKWLIEKGAEEKETIRGLNLLHSAAMGGWFDQILELIKKGDFSVHFSDFQNYVSIPNEDLPKYIEVIEYLLKERRYDLDSKYNDLVEKFLPIVIGCGNLSIIQFLENKGLHIPFENIDIKLIISSGYIDVIKFFIEGGINVNKIAEDPHLDLKIQGEGQLRIIEYLYGLQDKIDKSLVNGYLINLMRMAVESDKHDVMKWLDTSLGSNVLTKEVYQGLVSYAKSEGKIVSLKYLSDKDITVSLDELHFNINSKLTIELVKWLQDKGYDIRAKEYGPYSIMHWAASDGEIELIDYLKSQGVDINVLDKDGKAPIYYAVRKGNLKTIKHLGTQEADLSIQYKGSTLMHIALRKGMEHLMLWLLEQGISLDVMDCYSKTPINIAAKKGRIDIIDYLTKKRANTSDIKSYIPDLIEHAVIKQDINIIYWLQDKSVDIQTLKFIGQSGNLDALSLVKGSSWAARHGIKIDEVVDIYGRTLLHYAVFQENMQVFKWCIEKRINPNIRDLEYLTPLFYAIHQNKPEYVKLLLEYRSEPNIQGPHYSTPLHCAIYANQFECVKLLLEHGADFNEPNERGITPLLEALDGSDKTNIVTLLCSFKVNIDINNSTVRNYFTNSENFRQILSRGTVAEQIKAGLHILESLRSNHQTQHTEAELEIIFLDKMRQARPDILDNLDLINTRTNLKAILINLDKCKAVEGLEEKIQDFNHESESFKALGFLTQIKELNLIQSLGNKVTDFMKRATTLEDDPDTSEAAMAAMGVCGSEIGPFLDNIDKINLLLSIVPNDDQMSSEVYKSQEDSENNLYDNIQVEAAGIV